MQPKNEAKFCYAKFLCIFIETDLFDRFLNGLSLLVYIKYELYSIVKVYSKTAWVLKL